MERRTFVKSCCIAAVGIPVTASLLSSCSGLHYATFSAEAGKLIVPMTEFTIGKNGERVDRSFVLIEPKGAEHPICIYKVKDEYVATLLECTHRGCGLKVGGGVFTCPCHGSEFSTTGEVLEGPADENLKTYEIEIDNENIYIILS